MNIAALQNLIRDAQEHEAQTARLAQYIRAHLDELHPCIVLPQNNPQGALLSFIGNYANQVPHLLQAAHDVAQGAGISPWIKPVLKIAEQFFLDPPGLISGREGLEGVLSQAYLALRMVEEVNDRYIHHLGKPLIPMDLTVANLVVHELIGESFANQLDRAVEHTVNQMLPQSTFDQESVRAYRQQLYAPNVLSAWLSWPCFSRHLGVELALSEPADKDGLPVHQLKLSPVDSADAGSPSVTDLRRSDGTRPVPHRKP